MEKKIDECIKYVFTKKTDEWIKYALTEKEIEENIRNGLLSKNIRQLVTKKDPNSEYYIEQPLTDAYLKSQGVLASFINNSTQNRSLMFDSFYITDFFLIRCAGKAKTLKAIIKKNETKFVYESPDSLTIIPLEYVEKCEVKFSKNISGTISGTTKTVEKNPVKGAVIGAVLGGTTGAVIGAAANTGTKTETIVAPFYVNSDIYNLNIKIKDCDEYVCKKYYQYEADSPQKSVLANKNDTIKKLIDRAKNELSEDEKKKIVEKTIIEGDKEYKKQKVGDTIAMVVVVAVIVGLAFLISQF